MNAAMKANELAQICILFSNQIDRDLAHTSFSSNHSISLQQDECNECVPHAVPVLSLCLHVPL